MVDSQDELLKRIWLLTDLMEMRFATIRLDLLVYLVMAEIVLVSSFVNVRILWKEETLQEFCGKALSEQS